MAKPQRPDDTRRLESDEGKHLHYYNIIVVVPPVLDDKGKIVSLLKEISIYAEFISDLLEVIEELKYSGFESLKIFDVAELELSFSEEEDVSMYLKLIKKISLGLYKPLICFLGLGKDTEEVIQDVSLAQETEGYASIDTAIFNIPDPIEVWNLTADVSYIVGAGATKYHTRNIIINGHKGPLLSTTQVIATVDKKAL